MTQPEPTPMQPKGQPPDQRSQQQPDQPADQSPRAVPLSEPLAASLPVAGVDAVLTPTPDHTPPPDPAPDIDLFGNTPKRHPDWSHRRGEPRVLALLWTILLTIIATTTLMRSAIGGRLDIDVYRESLRAALSIIVTAIVLVWPLIRLSQATPREGPLAATMKDVLIAIVPLQAVLWPQVILAHWPISVVASVVLLLCVWAVLIGGVLALTLRHDPQPPRARALAMTTVILTIMLASLVALVLELGRSSAPAPAWWRLLSPHAGLYELTDDRDALGDGPRVAPAHFAALTALGTTALALWLIALARRTLAPTPREHETRTARTLAPDQRAR